MWSLYFSVCLCCFHFSRFCWPNKHSFGTMPLVAYRSGYVVLGTTFHLKTSNISALNYHELCLQRPGQFCFRVAVFKQGGKRTMVDFLSLSQFYIRNGMAMRWFLSYKKISTGTQRAGQNCLSLQRDTKVRLPGKTYSSPTEYFGCTQT